MEAIIRDCEGGSWALPKLLGWDVSHGFGSPCDCFELEFAGSGEEPEILGRAVEAELSYGGRTVFRGRIDEFELSCGESGALIRLRGRGMQALLLDNEAESADYYYPDLDYILERHARSLGIDSIDKGGGEGSALRFSVGNGWSHWKALSSFAEFCCGLRPRFSPEGCLVMDGEREERRYGLDAGTPLISFGYSEDRYGVISRVQVKRRYTNYESVSENSEFLKLGGSCSRIVNVPKSTQYDAMRHEGDYQIKKSMEHYRVARMRLAECFPLFPGDRVELRELPFGVEGEFLVTATRCVAEGERAYTDIEMRKL